MSRYPLRLFGGIAAGCAAAIVAAAATVYVTAYLSSPWPPGHASGPADYARISALMYTVSGAPVALAVALLFGTPAFLYMHQRGFRSARTFLGAGVLLSVVTAGACAIANQFLPVLTSGEFAWALLAICVAGPIGALTVRAIAYR